MVEESIITTVKVDGIEVFRYKQTPVGNWDKLYTDVPPGVISGKYRQLVIEVERRNKANLPAITT